ncbi:MAG: HD domain-containing protein [Mariprofundales bacterium]|nr:HD domain-containing protein [Mariprofundales bacterium]
MEYQCCNMPVWINLSTLPLPNALRTLCDRVHDAGGRAWLVGGWVRDGLLGLASSDFDVEVYHLTAEQLCAIAESIGKVVLVGKQFGVFKLSCDTLDDGPVNIDIALPRTERNRGKGHRGFSVQFAIDIAPSIAGLRRDFTINSMMFDPISHQLLDNHGGRDDLENRALRHVSTAFVEDPLRPLRAMQFCARFDLALAPETAVLCQRIASQCDQLPVERIWMEWRKWALSDYPAAGLAALKQSGWLHGYPQLLALPDCAQALRWHPEGDAWQHTQLVCNAAAAIANREALSEQKRMVLLFAALCHDLGKPATSKSDDQGIIRSHGHAEAGVGPASAFLRQIGAPSGLKAAVLPLVREHLVHLHGAPTPRAIRRLSARLQPVSMTQWEQLVEADASGRTPLPPDRPALPWLQQAEKMRIAQQPPSKIVTGSWLLAHGMVPGRQVGEAMRNGWQAQLDGDIDSLADAEQWWKQYIASVE